MLNAVRASHRWSKEIKHAVCLRLCTELNGVGGPYLLKHLRRAVFTEEGVFPWRRRDFTYPAPSGLYILTLAVRGSSGEQACSQTRV